MRFELKFNKEIYNKQMDLLFDLAWKTKKDYYKNSQYLGIILVLVGIVIIYNRPNLFGFGLIILGLWNLISFVYYYFKIKSLYKKLDIAKSIEGQFYENSIHVFEFTENSLVTNDGEILKCFNWNEFKIYSIIEDNLILITRNMEPLILGESEVGKQNFQEIISFVEKKIKIV